MFTENSNTFYLETAQHFHFHCSVVHLFKKSEITVWILLGLEYITVILCNMLILFISYMYRAQPSWKVPHQTTIELPWNIMCWLSSCLWTTWITAECESVIHVAHTSTACSVFSWVGDGDRISFDMMFHCPADYIKGTIGSWCFSSKVIYPWYFWD